LCASITVCATGIVTLTSGASASIGALRDLIAAARAVIAFGFVFSTVVIGGPLPLGTIILVEGGQGIDHRG
jgi:hypothetical protein